MYTKETESFNRPHKTTVAIDCRHIGDDNDYSCFLSDCIYQLWLSDNKEIALRLANTDPMLINEYDENSFENRMQEHRDFLIKQKQTHDAYYRLYID